MKLHVLLEGKEQKLVVVYGGRFQPFHLGHYHAYEWLCKHYGSDNVWIATSNVTNFNEEQGPVSPFTFMEKLDIMTRLYDVDPRRVIKCKNPAFSPKEVFNQYRDYELTYVSAVGSKDIKRYKDQEFFDPLPKHFALKDLSTLGDKKAYYTKVPGQQGGLSGTKVRHELLDSTGKEHRDLFEEFFGVYDKMIDELIVAKLKQVKEAPPKEEEPTEEPEEKEDKKQEAEPKKSTKPGETEAEKLVSKDKEEE